MEDRWHVIGPGDAPLLVCRKKDVPGLFDDDFRQIFEIWKHYHFKLPPPIIGSFENATPDLIECIMAMEQNFKMNFSSEQVIIKYLESIIKILTSKPRKKTRGR